MGILVIRFVAVIKYCQKQLKEGRGFCLFSFSLFFFPSKFKETVYHGGELELRGNWSLVSATQESESDECLLSTAFFSSGLQPEDGGAQEGGASYLSLSNVNAPS